MSDELFEPLSPRSAKLRCVVCHRTGYAGGKWQDPCRRGHPFPCACGRAFTSNAARRRHLSAASNQNRAGCGVVLDKDQVPEVLQLLLQPLLGEREPTSGREPLARPSTAFERPADGVYRLPPDVSLDPVNDPVNDPVDPPAES